MVIFWKDDGYKNVTRRHAVNVTCCLFDDRKARVCNRDFRRSIAIRNNKHIRLLAGVAYDVRPTRLVVFSHDF